MKNTITTSLELSKALKESGFKQESLFYCGITMNGNKQVLKRKSDFLLSDIEKGLPIASPTASELIDNLPEHIVIKQQVFRLTIDIDSNRRFYCNYLAYKNKNTPGNDCDLSVFEEHEKSFHGIWKDAFGQEGLHIGGTKSLANALAKLFIYLKEEGVL